MKMENFKIVEKEPISGENGSAISHEVTDTPKSESSIVAEELTMSQEERRESNLNKDRLEELTNKIEDLMKIGGKKEKEEIKRLEKEINKIGSWGDIYKKMQEKGTRMPSNEEMEAAASKVED